MKTNKKTTVFIKALIFSTVFSIIIKWWQSRDPFQPSTILFGIIILLIVLIALSTGNLFFQKILEKPVKQVKKIILPAFFLYLLVILLISLLVIGVCNYVFYLIMGIDTSNFMNQLLQVEFPYAIRSYSKWLSIAAFAFFYVAWQGAVNREQNLREENLKYQYSTLKNQVNPHFLFNSLNTLSEIVYVDAKKADNYIQKLSGVYRYILDNENTDLVPLKKEIELVQQYFELQKERDGNKIRLNLDIKNIENSQIIPVSLQILVENALKHNATSEEHSLIIHIYSELGYIVVSNNIQRKNILTDSLGTGLLNLEKRTKLITGKELIINQENNKFTVKIPIVSK